MIQEQHLLSSKKHLLSTDQDFQIKFELENSGKLLKETEINSLFNLDEQFNIERKNSSLYRIYGKINLLTYDEITKITNINSSSPENTVENIIKFKEISNKDIDLLDKNNWALQILYPFSADTISDAFDEIIFEDTFYNNVNKGWVFSGPNSSALQIVNGVMKYTGIVDSPVAILNNNFLELGKEYEITYEVKNLQNNGRVQVKFGNTNGILRIANGVYVEKLIPTTINIIIFSFIGTGILDDLEIDNIIIKIKSPTNKKKYRRLYKVLTDINDYDVFKSGFERNIFSDKIVQFIFNNDFDISRLTDYLGKPISELYLGIVKSGSTSITELKEGFNRIYPDSVNNFVHQIGDSYIGDEVIFDHSSLIQKVIGNRFHKFSYEDSGNLIFQDIFLNNFNKGWGLIPGITEIFNNAVKYTPGGNLGYSTTLLLFNVNVFEIGKSYTIQYDVEEYDNNNSGALLGVQVQCGDTTGTIRTSIGTYKEILTCNGNEKLSFNFNFNRTSQGNPIIEIDNILIFEGSGRDYYYKPFHKIDVKKFSNNIEIGNTGTTLGIPDYATKIDNEGNVKWKELLDVGIIEDGEGVNYPFVNGHHYLYNNYDLYLRRIVPFHNLSEIQALGIGPINSTTIQTVNTFGVDDEKGIPLGPDEKCVEQGDKPPKEPGPSGPGTSAEDEQNKNQDDNNDPKC